VAGGGRNDGRSTTWPASAGKLKVLRINVHDNQALAMRYDARSISPCSSSVADASLTVS